MTLEEQFAAVVPRMVLGGVGAGAADTRDATDDPWVVRQQWRAVADAIESVQKKLAVKTDDARSPLTGPPTKPPLYGMFIPGMYYLYTPEWPRIAAAIKKVPLWFSSCCDHSSGPNHILQPPGVPVCLQHTAEATQINNARANMSAQGTHRR
jgi:hypothetical protein